MAATATVIKKEAEKTNHALNIDMVGEVTAQEERYNVPRNPVIE